FISFFLQSSVPHPALHSFPTRRSSDLPQYRSAIFYHDATQKRLAEESKAVVEKRLGRVFTDILPASEFWRAEEYHQHYYKKNPVRYHFYRFNCGRDQRLAKLWGSAAGH